MPLKDFQFKSKLPEPATELFQLRIPPSLKAELKNFTPDELRAILSNAVLARIHATEGEKPSEALGEKPKARTRAKKAGFDWEAFQLSNPGIDRALAKRLIMEQCPDMSQAALAKGLARNYPTTPKA